MRQFADAGTKAETAMDQIAEDFLHLWVIWNFRARRSIKWKVGSYLGFLRSD